MLGTPEISALLKELFSMPVEGWGDDGGVNKSKISRNISPACNIALVTADGVFFTSDLACICSQLPPRYITIVSGLSRFCFINSKFISEPFGNLSSELSEYSSVLESVLVFKFHLLFFKNDSHSTYEKVLWWSGKPPAFTCQCRDMPASFLLAPVILAGLNLLQLSKDIIMSSKPQCPTFSGNCSWPIATS